MTGALRRQLRLHTAGFSEINVFGDSQASAGLALDGSTGYDPAIDVTDPNCFQRKQDGSTVVAQDPLDYAGGVATGAISFALPLMRTYAGRTFLRPRLTAGAQRGTSLVSGFLQPGGAGFIANKARFAAALAENVSNTALCLIWDGGSNDAVSAVSQADFTTYWTNAYTDLWSTFGALPTFVTGIVHQMTVQDAHFKAIDDALRALPGSFSNVRYVNTDTLLGYPASGPEHMTNVSHRLLGPAMDAALAAF
jgi:hypothetical protein